LINYADSPQATEVTLQNVDPKNKNVQLLNGTVFPVFSENKFSMKMPPYGIEVIKITAH
jgi:hypothetical protein